MTTTTIINYYFVLAMKITRDCNSELYFFMRRM